MGRLAELREDLEGLAGRLDEAADLPEVASLTEVSRARVVVEEARTALASAFLSRRAVVLAREAISRAHEAVDAALGASRTLREQSAQLRTEAQGIRSMAGEAREASLRTSEWARRVAALVTFTPPGQGEVMLESAIPPDHPHKHAIEAAVVATLSEVPGLWRVSITVPPSGGWWGLRVRGPDTSWVGALQDRSEQTAEGMRVRLEPLVRIALAEALYRRERRGPRSHRDAGG